MPEHPAIALELRDVEKQYGGLRPLRVKALQVAAGSCAWLIGFDRPAAETLVNLITGASLPDKGEAVSLGRHTREIADSADWLTFVEAFGIVSDRVVLLETMTVAQNLALPFDIALDPVPPDVLIRVKRLAAELGIDEEALDRRAGSEGALLQARIRLARALALDPALLMLEHPTATLSSDDANSYAATIKQIQVRRGITMVGLTVDEKFAKSVGGRLLVWQPATGDLKERRAWF